jgi:16S rRNA processing protein RimM
MSDIEVAQIGKVVGLKGDLKLHDRSDFPEQFCPGATFFTATRTPLRIRTFNAVSMHVSFEGYESRESARKLTNTVLYTTKDATRTHCELAEDEYFWFDIIGCTLVEDGVNLGTVHEIERIGPQECLHVKTAIALIEKGLEKAFVVPYVDRYVCTVDIEKKTIYTQDARELLESL